MADDVLVAKVFNFICGSGGFVELTVLLKPSSPLGSRKTKREAKDWLKAQGAQAGFVCVTDENDEITGVRIDLRKKICHQYAVKGSCRRAQGKCKYWHVCKSYIEGVCEGKCHLSHDFHSEDNKQKAKELRLEKLSNGTIRNIVAWSLPQVCQLYLRNECKSDKCPYLHVCSQDVRALSCKCVLSHDMSDSHNIKILKEYDLVPPHRVMNKNFVRCSILVLNEQKCIETRKFPGGRNATAATQETPAVSGKQNACSSGNTQATAVSAKSARKQEPSASPTRDKNCLSVANLTSKSYMRTPAAQDSPKQSSQGRTKPSDSMSKTSLAYSSASWTPCFLTEQKVFECLCKEYGSSISFDVIAKRKDLFPHGPESAEGWFRKTKGSFLMRESNQGVITQVDAFSARARVCWSYNKNGECVKHNCTNLHICRDYIIDSCSSGVTCPLNHHFNNQRDRAWLSRINLEQLTDLQLQKLVLSSTPQICVEYNNGVCNRGDTCNRIHMCCGYLRKSCSGEYECGLDHETAMDTDQTKAVLQRLMLSSVCKADILKMILDDKRSLSGKDKTKCHIHQDRSDASICSEFLIGKCKKGSRCLGHHCSMPYQWQYQVSISDRWISFSEEDNLTLEKLYCDVNVETPVNFKSAQSLDLSRLERNGRLPCDLKYEVMIDQENMTITFQRPRGGGGFLVGLLRRLSTVSYVISPCDPVFTNWKWYWKDNANVWHMFDRDYAGRCLQRLIEQAFQDTLDQGKTRTTFKFTTREHVYNLFFYSKGEMYQVNLKTGTKRQVKRRPKKPISDEDMDDLKWAHGDSSVKKRAAKSDVPSQWSSMPPSVQYTRVRLLPSSAEFNDVVQLFRKSMNDYVVVESIDRVQNPFMWEKYCRKKENMMAIARRNQRQVDEKRLFHGTSPGTVEAICKQNFDWRLHGKNATVYGEGSYFAVNASYSHAYAKRDADLSQFMFLARVLVGSYTEGHSSYRRPPPKQPSNPASDLYDSCVDDKSNPTIFVVFDTDQFYPEYVIKYLSQTTSDPNSSPRQPKPAPLSKHPSFQTHVSRSSSIYHGTVPNASKTLVRSGYSTPTSNSGLTAGNALSSINSPGTASKPSGSAASGGHSKVSQTHSASYSSSQPTTPLPKPRSSQTYPRGILKHPPSGSNNSESTPSGSAAVQFRYVTSAVSNSGLVSANPRRSTTFNPSGSAAQSGYSTMSQATSAANSSSPQPRTTTLARPLNPQTYPNGILKHQPSPSSFPAQVGYTASTSSSSGLTRENPIRSSNNLGTASNPSGSFARTGGSSSVRSCSAPSLPHTSGLHTRDVTPTGSHLSTSSRGFQTATNSNLRRTEIEECVLL